jgi:OmpA-OmpF porin, OOP family
LGGKVTRILYRPPEGRSVLEVFRNYEGALKKAGFVTLFTCVKEECVDVTRQIKIYDEYLDLWATNQGIRYLSGKLSRPEGDVYVSLFTQDGPWVRLYVVEEKPMQAGLVTVHSAASLAGDISRTGHASVYGIYFDTGKADVKPESDATLKEIAKLLQSDAGLKLYVVGHTDNQGALAIRVNRSMPQRPSPQT